MPSPLFSPFKLRSLQFPNRIGVSPMCQYSSHDGFASDWHLVHLGARAQGGAGLVTLEAAGVQPEGRITPDDLGIWKDEHIPGLERITQFIHSQGAVAGIQLAHAGRKASTHSPFKGDGAVPQTDGGWEPIAPSAIPFAPHYPMPRALDQSGISAVIEAFRQSALRALKAGFDLVEIHGAHGYLVHEFLSPLANHRTDEYGGSFDNRIRLMLQVTEAVRAEWPQHLPIFVRISTTDWADGGWTVNESVELARQLKQLGADLIDCSSGGQVQHAKIPFGPGYQVEFADRIRREVDIATAAVGMITEARQANGIIERCEADLVLLAREMLRDPYWPLNAAAELGEVVSWPLQYLRAAPQHSLARAAMKRAGD